MSRAFVRETDDAPEEIRERPISPHPNLVTPRGLAQIEGQVRALEAARVEARASGDKARVARIDRDLRYWTQRRATAQRIEPAAATDVVRFGMRVTLRSADGEQRFRLVGEDEADPAEGTISWTSPVACALLGRELGDVVTLPGRSAEIVAIEA
jgi:transcription elongation GreA/GreB family factor